MAKGSNSTEAPPPSVAAGTLSPGENADFPEGSTTKVGQFYSDFGKLLLKDPNAFMPKASGSPGSASFGAGQSMPIDTNLYNLKRRPVNFGKGSLLSNLSTLNFQ